MTTHVELNNFVFQSNNKSASDSLNMKKPLAIEEEMLFRAKTMREVCHTYGLDQPGNDSLHKPNAWEYLINKKHHLVWCNVFKSGSTRCQFHQHFRCTFFVRKCFAQLFSSYSLALAKGFWQKSTFVQKMCTQIVDEIDSLFTIITS
jgi:hypothetical protein